MITLLAFLSTGAHAQDGVDAHELYLAPQTGDVRSAFTVRMPTGMTRGDLYASTVFEYSARLLTLHQTYEDGSTGETLALGRAGVLNLGVGYAVHDRARLELALPVVPFSSGLDGGNGFAFGDLRLGGAVELVSTAGDEGLGIEIAPYLDGPTGAQGAFLGRDGFAGGSEVAAAMRRGSFTFGGSAGLEFQPKVALSNIDGADQFRLGLSGNYAPTDIWGVTAELVASPALAKNAVAGVGSPVELRAGGRYRVAHGFTVLGGAAVGVSPGIGAAGWRLFVGGSYGPSHDAVVEKTPVVVVPPTSLHLVPTFNGVPLDGARVKLSVGATAPEELTVAAAGISVSDLAPGTPVVATAAMGCLAGDLNTALMAGKNELFLPLSVSAGAVTWVAVDIDGKPVSGASVAWKVAPPCTPVQAYTLADGSGTQMVGVGTYTAVLTAAEFDPAEVALTVRDGSSDQRVVLTRTASRVKVQADNIVVDGMVFFDTGTAVIQAKSNSLLDDVARTLIGHPEITKSRVAGYTDDVGDDALNLDLSQRRADAVKAYLVGKGVSADVLEAVGYGEANPAQPNDTEAHRTQNRRVLFTILERAAQK